MKKIITTIAAVILSAPAFADSTCEGKVTYLGVSRGANVVVVGPGGMPSVYLCDLQEKQNNVEPEACKAMYASLLAAKAQDKSVRITFNPNLPSCSDLESWKWAPGFNWVLVD